MRALTHSAIAIIAALSMSVQGLAANPRSLLVGVFKTENGANDAYKELKDVQKTNAIAIDAFAVVEKDAKGKVSVHDTQQRHVGWGAVAGGVLGLLVMGPIGAVAGVGAGGLTGWLSGKAVGIPSQDIDSIKTALEPNTSAIVAVVDNKWVGNLEAAFRKAGIKTLIKDGLADQEAPAAAH